LETKALLFSVLRKPHRRRVIARKADGLAAAPPIGRDDDDAKANRRRR
jgi:hypothetical protein